jgi:pentatricopeptide repeat protein
VSGNHPAISKETMGRLRVQVLVRDNNVDQALKVLKKKMQREGALPRDEAPQPL